MDEYIVKVLYINDLFINCLCNYKGNVSLINLLTK